jgi:glycosyltransferase involved in cell wall biosynthesis
MINILTTYFNSPGYIEKCLNSLKSQSVKDFRCFITDDMSTDNSSDFVKSLAEKDSRFIYIKNTSKMYQSGNYWQIVNRPDVNNDDICVTVDGDDWLPDKNVLERVVDYYADGKTWMTFGQFLIYHNYQKIVPGFCKKPNNFKLFRSTGWTSSHLRTFKTFLLKMVDVNDLQDSTGSFWKSAGDVAIFSPMMEMSGEERIKYISDVNYVYNMETPLNDCKVDVRLQINTTIDIHRKQKKYITL